MKEPLEEVEMRIEKLRGLGAEDAQGLRCMEPDGCTVGRHRGEDGLYGFGLRMFGCGHNCLRPPLYNASHSWARGRPASGAEIAGAVRPASPAQPANKIAGVTLHLPSRDREGAERLFQVRDDIVGVLDPYREAHEAVADSHALAVLGRDLAVRTHHRV